MEPKTDPAPTPDVVVPGPETPSPEKSPPVGDLPMNPAAPPPGPAGKMTDAELAQYDATSVRLMNEKMDDIDAANKEFEDLNGKAKAAKGVWMALDEQLHRLIKERREARGKPIQKTLLAFTNEEPATPTEQLRPAAESGPDPLENLWRAYPIERLTIHGMTEKDVEKLAAGTVKRGGVNPVLTVGELADWTANAANPGYERRITDFEGVGPGAATRINDALDLFWKQWAAGGREEFATERGLATNAPDAGGGSGVAGEGGDGHVPGQPEGPADPARAAEANVYPPAEDRIAGPGDSYDLGGREEEQ